MKNLYAFEDALATIAALTASNFFADEIGLNGGQIRALQSRGLIEKTGNTKIIQIITHDETPRDVSVFEWHII